MKRTLIVLGCLGSLAAPGLANAASALGPRELIPGRPTTLTLLPGGIGLLTGQAASKPPYGAKDRLAARPVGGPLGAAAPLPGALAGTGVLTAHDAAGNVLIADAEVAQIAYRSVAGTFSSTVQSLGGGNGVGAIGMAPTGEALVAVGGSPGTLRIAFRPAGPDAQVDLANAQTLPGAGRIIGLQLDADGAAVAVYVNGSGVLLQTTRPAGSSSFTAPVSVPSGIAGNSSQFQVRMASDPSGWAVMTWGGGGNVNVSQNRAVATVRPPGGAFGAPTDLGGTLSIGSLSGAVNAAGHAVVTWFDRTKDPDTPCSSGDTRGGDAVARVGVYTGSWATSNMGPGTWPEISFPEVVAAAGNTVALTTVQSSEGPAQCGAAGVADDRRTLYLHRGLSEGSKFTWKETTTLQAAEVSPNGQFYGVSTEGLGVEPGGSILAAFQSGQNFHYLRAYEDPAAAPPASGTPPPVGGTATTPAPVPVPVKPTTPPAIKPIVPVTLVAIITLQPNRPYVIAVCPPQVASECRFRVAARLAFGITSPDARAAAAKQGALIGTGRATVAPGKKRRIAIKLNKAGRKVVARHRAVKVRITTTVTADGKTYVTKKTTTLKAAKRKRR